MAVLTSTGYRTLLLGNSSFRDIFEYGSIEIRTGTQPETADHPATGSLIARVTYNGGAWTPGSTTNGLRFLQDGPRIVANPAYPWMLKGSGTGTAGWFRLLPVAPDSGVFSATAPRIDGAIDVLTATTDSQLLLPVLSILPSTSIVIPYWWYGLPPI